MYTESISFIDCKNKILFSFKIKSLPIKEEGIIRKSIEFFNDPEPCFIHRGAVAARITAEIYEYFSNNVKKGMNEIQWVDFPEKYKNLLNVTEKVYSVRFL